ncbi:HAMP domain-containing histidine kinase [Fulvivirga sp. M361]|uniref:HAMP domain-containing sensor histidine kinase n=1 Tax=Fulvivirga sp. M361 TaxID=2594266 RepID=UPI001179E1AE|nr:HAMP domain-containing sensor histidine kinase [Fulvivirga sp. M361]TRX45851.1 HAMP domain-containing histidine kinase [Fulvivirga sp. M361]
MSSNIYDDIRKRHLQILPREQEHIVSISRIEESSRADSLKEQPKVLVFQRLIKELSKGDEYLNQFPSSFFEKIISEEYAQAKKYDTYYVGIPYSDNQGDFIVVISAVDKYGQSKLSNLLHILIAIFLANLGVIYIVGSYYARQILKPISKITIKANQISAMNLHLRLETGRKKDELTELALTLNNMLDRLETSFDIQRSFVNNASHELRNPLTAILGEVEIALRNERSKLDYIQSLKTVEKEAGRLEPLVKSLLKLAETNHGKNGLTIESLRIDELLLDVKDDLDSINPDNNIIFDFTTFPDDPDQLIIQGSKSLLKMVFTNIMDNACKFSNNSVVIVKIKADYVNVIIEIIDYGVGVPQDELKSIIEPFFRASNVRNFKGFGIGLPLAHKIIKIHGGQLVINSTEGTGTFVLIIIPKSLPQIEIRN